MIDHNLMIHRFFRAVDAREWDTVGGCFADQVRLDYTSLFDGEPETLTPEEILGRWQGLLPGFEATMHFLGPLVEDGDTVECNVRGYHHLEGQTWMVAGWYTLTVIERDERPLIAGITLASSYEEGSRDLVARAQENAAR